MEGGGRSAAASIAAWLAMWLGSRLVVAFVVISSAFAAGVDQTLRIGDPAAWLLYRFAHWDSHLYAAVAVRGYAAAGPASHYNAFFPGLPMIMRAWGWLIGGDVRWGGLLAVVVAGAVAAVLLGRLAVDVSGRPDQGLRAVALLSVAPLTVFFSVVYTEAPVLAVSVGAWLAARQRRWLVAGVLAGLACTLRLNGVFLALALVVLYVTRERAEGRLLWRPGILALGIGPAFIVAWAAWLHALTGRWDAWSVAQRVGWGRGLAWPWVGLGDGLHKVATASSWHLLASRLVDLGAFGVAVWATVHYLRRRNWPVATLIGLNGFTVVFSSVADSASRYLITWFPLYISIAGWAVAHPRRGHLLTTVSALLALVTAYAWGRQWWVA